MHILLTRPENDAAALKARIEALGCRASLAPLLKISFLPIAPSSLVGASAIVATSRNGLRALAQSDALIIARALTVFAVGPGTAQLAQELGFTTIISGPGTGAELVPIIVRQPDVRTGTLVHLAGDHLAFNLAAALSEQNITVTTIPSYTSVAAETLPEMTVSELAAGTIDAVVLMSPRSATTWARLTGMLPITPTLTDITHICLSDAVAGALSELRGVTTVIADRPNADAIISAVYRLAGSAKTE